MKQTYGSADLAWTVTGYAPYAWDIGHCMELGVETLPDVPPVAAPVPGSVQEALRQAGVLPDWNIGLNSRACEWVENRHWVYSVTLPGAWFAQAGACYRLRCLGLDGVGRVFLNGLRVGGFANAHAPLVLALDEAVRAGDNRLEIVFETPPRSLGQINYTSRLRDLKPRFNYGWDWVVRLVQVGIWDEVLLEVVPRAELADVRVQADYDIGAGEGRLAVRGTVAGAAGTSVSVRLRSGTQALGEATATVTKGRFELAWDALAVAPWQPNGLGAQPLYDVDIQLQDAAGDILDTTYRRVGFKHVCWEACRDAPPEADPWICVVNGAPVFLQGVNWTPLRANFADVSQAQYRHRLEQYRDLGVNLLRVWGGAVLEKACFYDMCDELGLMVWQELPLSSSGLENLPPDDDEFVATMSAVARSYVTRRQHHVSLLLWSGGNELTYEGGQPIGFEHPLMARLQEVFAAEDPGRRFVTTSPTGPRFSARAEAMGQGLHWDVHGPWNVMGPLDAAWEAYWRQDDSLFRSEAGAPGPSDAALIRRYRGDLPEMPATKQNPLWGRTSWWVEWDQCVAELGRVPADLEEYVRWGQQRQARILRTIVGRCKERFPGCGGVLLWMGHDCFPCTANTSIIDFEGQLKPAAQAVGEVFRAAPKAAAAADTDRA